MSQLARLVSRLKESGAERVLFVPNEPGLIDADTNRPLGGGPVRAGTILEAVCELLSNDDIQGLSATRPRIVRHEHEGDEFVLEILRHPAGLSLGIRPSAKPIRSLRDSVKRDEPRRPEPPKPEPPAVESLKVTSETARVTRPSKRMRLQQASDKRTVRAIVDDDGNLVDPGDSIPIELNLRPAGKLAAPPVEIRLPEERAPAPAAAPPVAPPPPPSGIDLDDLRGLIGDAVREIVGGARDAAVEAVRLALESTPRQAPDPAPRFAATSPGPASDLPRPTPAGAARIDALLHEMLQRKASDLHLSASCHPVFRIDGEIHFARERGALSSAEIFEMVGSIISARARTEFAETHDADFAYEIAGAARFRVNVFRDRHGTGAVFRRIPIEILSAEQLGLPKACLDLCWLSKGLVLVTGPTGSGKSTTLAAMIDFINKSRADHIITIEDPVEFVHQNQRCLVNQREVGQHTKGFKHALRAALREDPDIVLVGELRDLETIAIAIETAETGHLVFGTLHTSTAISTVDRIIDQFPADQQDQIRVMLSESLKGVIAQILCPKIGGGRVAAHEILLGNHAVSALIREGKTFQIASVMQTSKGQGMVTMNDSLLTLVQRKLIDPKQAYLKAVDKSGFAAMLRSAGIQPPV
jgi:twitching motility protein PilT